jgi:hypothetical protein
MRLRPPRPMDRNPLTGERVRKVPFGVALVNRLHVLKVWRWTKTMTCDYRNIVATKRLFGMSAAQYREVSKTCSSAVICGMESTIPLRQSFPRWRNAMVVGTIPSVVGSGFAWR